MADFLTEQDCAPNMNSATFGRIKQKYQNRNRISEKLLIL